MVLWGIFISHILRRLDKLGLADELHFNATAKVAGEGTDEVVPVRQRTAGCDVEGALSVGKATRSGSGGASRMRLQATPVPSFHPCTEPTPRHVLLIIKHGRRALLPAAYRPLMALIKSRLELPVLAIKPAELPLRVQLAYARQSCIGVTPDGGTSFLLAFLPAGGAVVVLGSLERWLWSFDSRLRAFYCQPRRTDAVNPCPPSAHGAATSPLTNPAVGSGVARGSRRQAEVSVVSHGLSTDCYELEPVRRCVSRALLSALAHVHFTWPHVGQAESRQEGQPESLGRRGASASSWLLLRNSTMSIMGPSASVLSRVGSAPPGKTIREPSERPAYTMETPRTGPLAHIVPVATASMPRQPPNPTHPIPKGPRQSSPKLVHAEGVSGLDSVLMLQYQADAL